MVTEHERLRRRKYERVRYTKAMSLYKAYLGGKCVVCGSVDKLEFHHKNTNSKKFAIADCYGHPWMKVMKELAKCELRCSLHHKQKHEAKHGTISRYRNQRCRCSSCVRAWSEASKRWRKTYREKHGVSTRRRYQ